MKSFDSRSGRIILLGAAAALALGAARPALGASSDDDFAASIHEAVDDQAAGAGKLFHLTTQESGPDDPLLLAQAPLINLIKKVEPSVVFLRMDIPAKNDQKASQAICTGFFTDSSKYLDRASIIATNSHCVEDLDVGAEITIGLYDGNDNRPKMAKGKILAYGDSQAAKDVAFVELDDASLNRPPLTLWEKLDDGEQVVAIGNPRGFTFSVTRGIVSALQRDHVLSEFVLDLNQSDAAVNPGNSGGPLFNMWGSVVGINEAIVSKSGGFEGISLSVPARYIIEAMKQYRRTGNLKTGALQIALGPDKDTRKVTIISVAPGGPAEAAHLQAKDQIVSVDGINLDGLAPEDAEKAFIAHLKYMSPGEKTSIVVRRDGQEITLEATLGEKPAPAPERPDWAPIPKKPAPQLKPTADDTVAI